jgi:hypothetical protein
MAKFRFLSHSPGRWSGAGRTSLGSFSSPMKRTHIRRDAGREDWFVRAARRAGLEPVEKVLTGTRRESSHWRGQSAYAGTVDVAETVVEVEGRLLFGPPKTRAGRRRIGLPRRVVDELALHLRAPSRPTDPVFRSPAGGPLRVTAFRNRIWRPATLAAGLPGLRIHDLRHTAVALWIAAGVPRRRSRSGPGTPRPASCWTATATCSPSRSGAPRPPGRAVRARDGTTTEHDRLATRPGRRNRVAPCALSWCDVGVEVRGFEPLASSVRVRRDSSLRGSAFMQVGSDREG